jgi:hypothetical protein
MVAIPSYQSGWVGGAAIFHLPLIQGLEVYLFEATSSLLTRGFNTCWCAALTGREKLGFTHFLMMHADVKPRGDDWFQVLMREMVAMKADVLSVAIPFHEPTGLTSTALDTDPWHPMRFTMKELYDLPATWTSDKLLVNTGLLLIDLRKPWVEEICFHIEDRIVRDQDGNWIPLTIPEDWGFSRQARALGASIFVTRTLAVDHYGGGIWPNDYPFGQDHDTQGPTLAEAINITGIDGKIIHFRNTELKENDDHAPNP